MAGSGTITDLQARKAAPKDKPYKLAAGAGLYLEVRPSGAKYWRMKYRMAGKEKLLAFGVYPEVSVKDAQRKCFEARQQIADGIDPSEQKRRDNIARKQDAANTFRAIALEWHDVQRDTWTPSHAERVMTAFEKDAFPFIGHRPITEIEPADIESVLARVTARDALDVAERLLQRCGAVFTYAIRKHRLKINPCTSLVGTIKKREVQHRPAMSRKDMPEFLNKLDHYDGHPLTIAALKLTVLTFLRPGEIRHARWEELDWDAKQWHIPAARMKMRNDHIVPLSRQTLALLESLRPLSGRHALLFPGQRDREKPISENTMTYALYRMGYKDRATAHGFRATASTLLNEQGFRPDAIERQLAHQEQNKIRAAYHRTEYIDERTQMMQAWADYLDRLKSGAQVVELGERRARKAAPPAV